MRLFYKAGTIKFYMEQKMLSNLDWKGLKHWFQAAVIILSAVFMGYYFKRHGEELLRLKDIGVINALYLVGIFAAVNVIVSYKLFLILRHLQLTNITFWRWFQVFIVSRFVNFHFSQGATFYRILKLKKSYDFAYTKAFGMLVFSSWAEMVANLVVTNILLLFLPDGSKINKGMILYVLFILLSLVLVSPYLLEKIVALLPAAGRMAGWAKNKLVDLAQSVSGQIHNTKLLAQYIALTLITLMLFNLSVYVCFYAIKNPLDLLQTLLFTIALLLSRSVNVTPGNIGLAELICGYFSQYLGATVGSGIIVSGIIRIVEYIMLGLGTLCFHRSVNFSRE